MRGFRKYSTDTEMGKYYISGIYYLSDTWLCYFMYSSKTCSYYWWASWAHAETAHSIKIVISGQSRGSLPSEPTVAIFLLKNEQNDFS